MRLPTLRPWLLGLPLLLALAACADDAVTPQPPATGWPWGTISATYWEPAPAQTFAPPAVDLRGQALDPYYAPLPLAQAQAGAAADAADADGRLHLVGALRQNGDALTSLQAPGHFVLHRRLYIRQPNTTLHLAPRLPQRRQVGTVANDSGGTLARPEVTLRFAPGYAQDSTGQPYAGRYTVELWSQTPADTTVAASPPAWQVDPADPTHPGQLIDPLGLLWLRLNDDLGRPLFTTQPDSGLGQTTPSTHIGFCWRVDAAQRPTLPDSVPLWALTRNGTWRRTGTLGRSQDSLLCGALPAGGCYALGMPGPQAVVVGQACQGGEPTPGITLRSQGHETWTDAQGRFLLALPAGSQPTLFAPLGPLGSRWALPNPLLAGVTVQVPDSAFCPQP